MPFTVSGILSLTSCIKDELPNSECDIISANAGVKNPEDVFFQLSDTSAAINADYHSSVIQFQRVKTWADLTEVAPRFTVFSSSPSILCCPMIPATTCAICVKHCATPARNASCYARSN